MKPVWLALVSLFPLWCSASDVLSLNARSWKDGEARSAMVQIDPRGTAIIICDMWDQHWCKGATERVAEIAPRMNEVVSAARKRGIFIIHAPSETMEFYKDTPQRKRAIEAPPSKAPAEIGRWRRLDQQKESAYEAARA